MYYFLEHITFFLSFNVKNAWECCKRQCVCVALRIVLYKSYPLLLLLLSLSSNRQVLNYAPPFSVPLAVEVSKHGAWRPQKPWGLLGTGRRWGRGYGGWGRGRLYTYHYTVTTRMIPALRWASMRAILMFHSFIVRDSVTRQCPQTTRSEEKGELKLRANRTCRQCRPPTSLAT